jgi:nuclear factor related to kappa-B-binding protein
MLRDSTFLAPDASSVTLNSVVSGALDRLHYERDPCVRYDSHKKSWIYLHRDRTQEQFGKNNKLYFELLNNNDIDILFIFYL